MSGFFLNASPLMCTLNDCPFKLRKNIKWKINETKLYAHYYQNHGGKIYQRKKKIAKT